MYDNRTPSLERIGVDTPITARYSPSVTVNVSTLPKGAPERVVAELEERDPTSLSPEERTSLASARNAVRQARGSKSRSSDADRVRVHPESPCPDPTSPDALRLAWEKAYRLMWALMNRLEAGEDVPAPEVQSITAVYHAARLAYGIGKAAPADESSALDFGALMGRKAKKA